MPRDRLPSRRPQKTKTKDECTSRTTANPARSPSQPRRGHAHTHTHTHKQTKKQKEAHTAVTLARRTRDATRWAGVRTGEAGVPLQKKRGWGVGDV
jgi:hypothetical protein